MKIIVALDILDGKCVRLTRGDYSTKKIYNENPLEMARQIEDHGLEYIHLVDLDGARKRHVVNHRILEELAVKTSLNIDFGGGIGSYDDLKIAFECGAMKVTCGTIAFSDPPLFLEWMAEMGPDKIILGADCKDRKLVSEGWMKDSETDVISYIRNYQSHGVKNIICTDIDRDGMLQGPSTELYKEILNLPGLNLIASGGVSSINDIETLREAGCEGVIVGKAVYEGRVTLTQLCRLC
ncbi:MAG TPA: 1-(5-phosphoribosyl)-5-[(5-phosphoribosylamino)methylideneamino]imidazole-4-carboxamide isomerase [Bacteroidales bacterium]|nr:1-(5-phosphoribosyl)-5-[(5-phosphoribosylamino)methylideneamino]imidazole-4-carboxamide isomerase [Bacteroidales bacterium]